VHVLALMEIPVSDYEAWEKKLHFLVAGVKEHIETEETTLINIARQDMSAQQREELGDAFLRARAQKLSATSGSKEDVKKLVEEKASMMMKLKEKVMG